MNEVEFQELLAGVLLASDDMDEEDISVRTYEEVGMLTMDKGLVVQLADGSEFQVTIKKSR